MYVETVARRFTLTGRALTVIGCGELVNNDQQLVTGTDWLEWNVITASGADGQPWVIVRFLAPLGSVTGPAPQGFITEFGGQISIGPEVERG